MGPSDFELREVTEGQEPEGEEGSRWPGWFI